MKRTDFEEERSSKKELGIKDFNLLTTKGSIAFYQECELTHIYLIEKETKNLIHYFAILSYEEFTETDKNLIDFNLTKPPVKINKKYSLGISKMRISLDDSKDIFNQLCSGSFTFNGARIEIPTNTQLLPKTHIPVLWGNSGVMLNKVLKPNFWGDKYILEFMSLENPLKTVLSSDDFEKINSEIFKILPIDLSSVYDRIGSFIFQFPITPVTGYAGISNDWCKAKLSMNVHSDFSEKDDLCSIVKASSDGVVTGFNSYEGYFENIELDLGDANDLEFKIFNRKNGLIYFNSMGNFIRNIGMNLGFSAQNSEPRIFEDKKGETHEVMLISNSISGSGNYVSYDTRAKKRIIQNEILSKSGRFLSVNNGERYKALGYIHQLLNEKAPSSSEIWLWDPYLRYGDIIDTLYHVRIIGITMKCITTFKKKKRQEDESRDFHDFKVDEKEKLIKASAKHLGMKLDYRATHGMCGFDFHDRFLFFIPKEIEEIPVVYSLGASINKLGEAHHLIQQTLDPRNIIKTFKELWTLLDNEESILVKLPEDLKK